MTTIIDLKLVTIDNVHEMIPNYIHENKIIITDYEDMINVVLDMIKNKHFFNMDKNFLRGCMEDLTYMYCPGDDVNKDRVLGMLEPSDDEDERDGEDEGEGEDEDEDEGERIIIPKIKKDTLVVSDLSEAESTEA